MTTTEKNPFAAIADALHAALDDPDALDAVPVDSGNLLIVDPCHIDAGTLAAITQPNEYGVTAGVVVSTPAGDGWVGLYNEGDGTLHLQAPFWEHDGGDWAVAPDEILDILTGGR